MWLASTDSYSSDSASGRTSSSRRPISSETKRSWVIRLSVASCSARAGAAAGGIIVRWSQNSNPITRERSAISARRVRSSSYAVLIARRLYHEKRKRRVLTHGYPGRSGVRNPCFPGILRSGATPVRERSRAGMRQDPGLLRRLLGVRAAHLHARGGRGRTRGRGVHARLLPTRAGPLSRGDGDEAVARHPQEPEASQAARALSGRPHQALLQARPRTPGPAIRPRPRLVSADARIGARVAELGRQIAEDYAGREPLLVGALKACFVFLADLMRALPIVHRVDFVELAAYEGSQTGGHKGIRLLKDLDRDIAGQDLLLVEDVVDTGLTLNYLVKTLRLRDPRSVVVVTLLDRPYRRLVEDLPVEYVGFTVPDEFFVGYGFDLDERFRNLPDLHLVENGLSRNGSSKS